MKNLISEKGISVHEFCKRMGKYQKEINAKNSEFYEQIFSQLAKGGVPVTRNLKTEKLLKNFSDLVCMSISGMKGLDEKVRLIMSDIIHDKIPITYVEKFIFGFKEIVMPYVQKEFSEQYYSFFTAQKIIDSALSSIWLMAIDEYYHQINKNMEDSEKRFRTLFEFSRDAAMTLEPPLWRFTSGNPATLKMFKAKDEKEFNSKGPWELSPKYQPDGTPSAVKAKKMIMKAMKEGSNFFEWTHKRLDGEDFSATVLLSRMTLGGKSLLQATVRDISEQKRMEDNLRESEEKYKTIFESVSDEIIYIDKYGKILDVNQRVKDILGFDRSEMIGKNFMQLGMFNIINLPKMLGLLKNVILKGKPLKNLEINVKRKDGKEVMLETSAETVRKDGRIAGVVAILRDVTESKRMEREIKESEERYRTIFDNAGDGILIADITTKKFIMANRKICNMLGYTENELKSLGVMGIHPKKDLPIVLKAFKMQAQRKIGIARYLPMLRKDKSVFYADISSAPFVMNGKPYLIGFFRESAK
jgi:PAS domain S-box-containing protein